MAVTPDIAGFRAAQDRLRQQLGQDVTFRIPVPPTWPPGTQLDQETGLPFDPTVEPVSGGGFSDVTRRVGVVFRPIQGTGSEDFAELTRGGVRRGEAVALIVATADYASVQNATRFVLQGVNYNLTYWSRDDEADRWIAFGEAR